MKEKNRKVRKHGFVSRRPVLASVLLALLCLNLVQAGSFILKWPLSGTLPAFDWILGLAGLAITAAAVLWLYKRWFRPEYSGMISGNLKEGFSLLAPVIVYWIISLGFSFIFERDLVTFRMTGDIIETSFIAGVSEELCFRGLLICTLLRQWRKKDGFLKSAIVSAVTFGLVHALNVFGGANMSRTASQVLESGFLGFFYAAVFLRCGSLLPVMAVHTLHDIIAIGFSADVSEAGIITGGIKFSSFFDVFLAFCLLLAGIHMLRKDKLEAFRGVWNEKWEDPEPQAE